MSEIEHLFEETFIKESISEFIRKVYVLLENRLYEQIIGWDFDNRTVVIRDSDKITEEVLPIVFKQKTLKSFIRQLNMYNFRKVKKQGPENQLYFSNEHFVRGNLENLIFIRRKQRGYIEPSKLENLESKSTLEKYHIYASGMLNKLREQFIKIQDKYPTVANDLINILKSNIPPHSSTQLPFNMNQIEMFHPLVQQERQKLYLMESIREIKSYYSFPVLYSSFSIPDYNEQ